MKRYKKAYIEITNVCNLSCSFCAGTIRLPHFMNVDDFERVLNQVSPLTDYIYFHLMGEPLLHPEIDKLLEVAEHFGKKVIITTNGTLIGQKKDIVLNSKAVYKIVFSLHSFEANDIGIRLDEYLSEIISFAKNASQNTRIITALRLWNFDKNSLDVGKSLNERIFSVLENQFDLPEKITSQSFSARDLRLSERIFLQAGNKFDWPDLNREVISEKVFCYGLRDHFGVLCDGTIVPCCLDHDGDISLGNCLEKPLSEILDSERARRIYNGFSEKKAVEELCRRCGFVTKFL